MKETALWLDPLIKVYPFKFLLCAKHRDWFWGFHKKDHVVLILWKLTGLHQSHWETDSGCRVPINAAGGEVAEEEGSQRSTTEL